MPTAELRYTYAVAAVGADMFNVPVAEVKRQPSKLDGDLPFEPVTLTFRCDA